MTRALFALAVIAVVVAAATTMSADWEPATGTWTHEVCDWDTELSAALAARGEDPADWVVTPDRDGPGAAWVDSSFETVTVRQDQPCFIVRSIVNHEWMHLQQGRAYGAEAARAAYKADPESRELVADCGSKLLGSNYLPYLTEHTCTRAELDEARRLIAHRR